MVNLRLDEDWSLVSDNKNWILQKDDRYVYFFSDLQQAIQSYFEVKTKCSQARTISGLQEYMKRALRSLENALTPLKMTLKVVKKEVKK